MKSQSMQAISGRKAAGKPEQSPLIHLTNNQYYLPIFIDNFALRKMFIIM